jgi:hypothetical protein
MSLLKCDPIGLFSCWHQTRLMIMSGILQHIMITQLKTNDLLSMIDNHIPLTTDVVLIPRSTIYLLTQDLISCQSCHIINIHINNKSASFSDL